MGCCDELVTTLTGTPPDPSQHLNYARGMVLGVDDFTQEFAYLAGRGQWLARDAIGYGTLSGLRVSFENDGNLGPRLQVTAGSALVPSGQLVCVPTDQCAVINKWLAKSANAAIVNRLLNPVSPPASPPMSPPMSPAVTSGEISLYLTLCYTDCRTRPVPIPGEPCRSDDELMEPSRVADDYRLELHEKGPAQVEEDALRDFVRWLRANVHVIDTGSPPTGDDASWLDALRPAAQPWFDAAAMSPPLSPPASVATLGDYLFDLPPFALSVDQNRLGEFLRVAFRFWVTELRPLWIAYRCHRAMQPDGKCVQLARVAFDVIWVGGSPTGTWQIDGSPATVLIDETKRPFLTHLRLLQEWLLCGPGAVSGNGGGGGGGSALNAVPRVPVRATHVDLTLDETDYCVVCRKPANTVMLPQSAGNAGRVYVIKNVDIETPSLVIVAASGETIDGTNTREFTKGRSLTVVADGTGQWHIIGRVP